MSNLNQEQSSPQTEKQQVEALKKQGITRVPIDYFHIGEYRYTSLDDAVAEAKRVSGKVS